MPDTKADPLRDSIKRLKERIKGLSVDADETIKKSLQDTLAEKRAKLHALANPHEKVLNKVQESKKKIGKLKKLFGGS